MILLYELLVTEVPSATDIFEIVTALTVLRSALEQGLVNVKVHSAFVVTPEVRVTVNLNVLDVRAVSLVVMVTLRSAATNVCQPSDKAELSVFVKAYVAVASVHELDPVY